MMSLDVSEVSHSILSAALMEDARTGSHMASFTEDFFEDFDRFSSSSDFR